MRMKISQRMLAVLAFSFLFAYLLSVLFEGRVLYDIMVRDNVEMPGLVTLMIAAHMIGLFTCGYWIRTPSQVRQTVLIYVAVCMLGSVAFFFPPGPLWWISGMVTGFSAGCAIAAWGYYFRALSRQIDRLRICADCLIGTYILYPIINLVSGVVSPFLALFLAMVCLLLGAWCIWRMPVEPAIPWSGAGLSLPDQGIRQALGILCAFIIIVTINAGLLYQVIAPAFTHLSGLNSWYSALPYIAAILIVRQRSLRSDKSLRSGFLYTGLGILVLAFIVFLLTDRSIPAYLAVTTLMSFSFGILDLFWWSVLGFMLDDTVNPVRLLGFGLSANVLGILLGRFAGGGFTALGMSAEMVTVAALVVICMALIVLPILNGELSVLIQKHAFITGERTATKQQRHVIQPMDPLTEREHDVLQQILTGKSNRDIAATLFISENTVKTHARSIFAKYNVSSRAELISLLLKNA